MDLRSRIKQIEKLETASHSSHVSTHGFQASSLSPMRSVPQSHMSQTSTPLRGGATPRDVRTPNLPLPHYKPKSPTLTHRSDETSRTQTSQQNLWIGGDLHPTAANLSDFEQISRLLTEKESNCMSLTRALEQMKAEISEKNKQIAELRSIIGTYEGKLKTYFAKDYEKLLVQKDVQIQQLEDDNRRFKDKLDQETHKLARLLADGDRKLSEVRQQIVVLIKKNQELESQKSPTPLYEVLQKFQRENKMLSDKLQSQAAQTITHEQYQALEEQFHSIEDMQNSVIGENSGLKSQLEDAKQVETTLLRSLGACFSWQLEAQNDLQQLIIVVKTVKEGTQIDLKMLLSSGLNSGKRPEAGSVEALTQLLSATKAKMSELKTLLLEVYSDYCSQDCTVH